ncbi:hypothetical protein BDD12DRAFT_750928 [Trichophaea hybrida]|nr:hypothetical protein BDD12DRAFT_750928 [Trichophaea hybrida]
MRNPIQKRIQQRPNTRTLRIFGVPPQVTKDQLEADLLKLSNESSQGDLKLSLVPANDTQISTVTFPREPPHFTECKPGQKISLNVEGICDQLVFDCDFFGMTPLYSATEPTVDIVAMTGLAGHAFGSWKSPGKSTMWLRDFLPLSLPDVRILTYGYDSALKGSTSTNSIQQYSR